jgi:aspartate aminotransferase
MRTLLVEKLQAAGSTHDWSHITQQIGMFVSMCDRLTNDYAIYLTRDGGICLAGLNPENIDYVTQAIDTVTEGKSIAEEDASS